MAEKFKLISIEDWKELENCFKNAPRYPRELVNSDTTAAKKFIKENDMWHDRLWEIFFPHSSEQK